MFWTPDRITEICEYFNRAAGSVTPGDGSHEDRMLLKLMKVFWSEQRYPVSIKESMIEVAICSNCKGEWNHCQCHECCEGKPHSLCCHAIKEIKKCRAA